MNRKQSAVPEGTSLNAEALHEISRLQENILQTLRNELKKLKEPEVMGASNVSTPVHEIGEDMTPLPSISASAVSLLKPVRQYSPLSPHRRLTKKLKPSTKKHVENSPQMCAIKYNYKLRDYPRPWAEPPQRRRTISEESLEVHVTASHFSDMSNIEPTVSLESQQQAPANEVGNDIVEGDSKNDAPDQVKANPDPERTESSEIWRKSIIFKSKPSKVLKYGINSKTNLRRTHSKVLRLQTHSPNAIVNQMMVKSPTKSSLRSIQKTVVFPAPVPDSKKLKLKNLTLKQSSNKYGLPLTLFEASDERNNNYLPEDPTLEKSELTSKAFCERLHETKILCDLVYQKLMKNRSVQSVTQQDETVQTDDIPGSFSSEFELGLFIATLIDELIDAACEIHFPFNVPPHPQGIKSNSHNYSPGKFPSWRNRPRQRAAVNETHIPVPTNSRMQPRTQSDVSSGPEQVSSVRRYNSKLREGAKSPVRYIKPVAGNQDSQRVRRGHYQESQREFQQRSSLLTTNDRSGSQREGSIPSSIKRALKSIATSPASKCDDSGSPERISDTYNQVVEHFKHATKALHYQLLESEFDSDDNLGWETLSISNSIKSKNSKCPSKKMGPTVKGITRPGSISERVKTGKLKEPGKLGVIMETNKIRTVKEHRFHPSKEANKPEPYNKQGILQSKQGILVEPTKPGQVKDKEQGKLGSFKKLVPEGKRLSNRQHQQQILNSIKSRRNKSNKIKRKLWWLFDSEYLDSSETESPSLSSLRSFFPESELLPAEADSATVRDFFKPGEDDLSDSSVPDVNHQIQQTYCSRPTILNQQRSLKTARKRNIKMSYHPPDFTDLFPFAGSILAEASQFMPKNPNLGKLISNRNYWNNVAVLNNKLLTHLWPKECTQ